LTVVPGTKIILGVGPGELILRKSLNDMKPGICLDLEMIITKTHKDHYQAPVPVTFTDQNEGAPGPWLSGTGDTTGHDMPGTEAQPCR